MTFNHDEALKELFISDPASLSDEDYAMAKKLVDEEHQRVCVPKIEERNALIKAWRERWPNVCKKCDGAGGWAYGGSMYEPPGFDDCDGCVGASDHSYCGRCHTINDEWVDGSDKPCKACGWDWGRGEDDICPPEYECMHMF